MGLLTALVGLPQAIEPLVWIAAYVGWGVLVVRYRLSAFVTPLLASVLSGVWTGGTQYVLREAYVANNPWYAEQIAEAGGLTAPAVLGFAVAMGLGWGLLVGGIVWVIAQRASSAASKHSAPTP